MHTIWAIEKPQNHYANWNNAFEKDIFIMLSIIILDIYIYGIYYDTYDINSKQSIDVFVNDGPIIL